MKHFKRLINSLEIQPLEYSLVFAGTWIFLRNFFEGVLEGFQRIGFSSFSYRTVLMYMVHFPMFYISLFLVLIIIISLVLNEKTEKVTGMASIGMVLLLLVPTIDWIVGQGYLITYPLRMEPYILGFLNPFVSIANIGVSPGQRIITVCIGLLIALYGYIKTKRLLKASILFLFSIATVILWGGLTTIIAGNHPGYVYVNGGVLYTDTQKYSTIYSLLFVIIFMIYCYMLNREQFRIVLESMRIERIIFYGFMSIFGYLIAMHQIAVYQPNSFNPIGVLVLFLTTGFGFCAVQVINDFFDTTGDKISRKRNPLVKGISRKFYFMWGICLSLLSLIFAYIISFTSFLIIATFLLLGIVYSVPPVRLKRIPIVSTFILAIAVVLAMGTGFSVYYGNRALNAIPTSLLVPTLIAVTLGFTAKDINDLEADKQEGSITLAALLLSKKTFLGRLLYGIIISMSYIIYTFFIPGLVIGAFVCSIVTLAFTLFAKKSKEWFYFVVLYVFGLYLLITILH